MGKSKYLLVLPMALTMLTACGNSEVNYKKADLNAAKEIAENYSTAITNSKASDVVVSGRINKFTVDGDLTWWHYTEANEGKIIVGEDAIESAYQAKVKREGILGLLMMIPNFSVKDSHVFVDPHDITTFTMPSSLLSLGKSLITGKTKMKDTAIITLANLPKFPMNPRLLRAIGGLNKLPEELTEEEWNKVEDSPWTKADVSYFTSGSRLKVTITTQDVKTFIDEVSDRYSEEHISNVHDSEKKYPGSFTITTNEIGYVDSLSVNFKLENIDEKQENEFLYLSVKGNVEVDLALNFKQTISDPITIKYQLSAYRKPEEGETPDVIYKVGGASGIPLKYDEEKSKPLTTDLSTFSDYLTFDWYSNTKSLYPEQQGGNVPLVLTNVYDDPIFCYNYWNAQQKNIAFSNESYDVLAIPKYTIDETTGKANPVCQVLGGAFHEYGTPSRVRSMVTTSVDGRVISTDGGLFSGSSKILDAAGDAVHNAQFGGMDVGQPIIIKNEDKEIRVPIDEIFINSNFLGAKGSEYIINIPIGIM